MKTFKITLEFYKQEFIVSSNTISGAKTQAVEKYYKSLAKTRIKGYKAKEIKTKPNISRPFY